MKSPLEGIRVVDLSEEIAGPFCSMQLSDAGAEVIKVEPPGGDCARRIGPLIGGQSALFMTLNRGKRSLAVDVSKERGKDVVLRLAESADVFLESFRPAMTQELGLDYHTLKRANPKLVYCAITPLGEEGPYKGWPASELEVQGMSGFLSYMGEPGVGREPVRIGAGIASISAGMAACSGIAAALFYRQRTGVGQKVSTSLLRAIMANAGWLTGESEPDEWRGRWADVSNLPPDEGYRTRDVPMVWGLFNIREREKIDAAFAEMCRELGAESLLESPWIAQHGPRMIGMGRDAMEVKPLFEDIFSSKSCAELVALINRLGGLASPIQGYDALFNHPQFAAIGLLKEVEHPVQGKIKVIGPLWDFPHMSAQIQGAPPLLGQHTKDVLKELGYTGKEIEELEIEDVVFCGTR